MWIKLKLKDYTAYFCFFYAPGAHLSEEIRLKFYKIFSVNYDKFAAKGKVFLIGDSNARLGEFLNDLDINGNAVSNKNKPLFLGFLRYSGLTLLNKKYCFGIPTYKIVKRKQS